MYVVMLYCILNIFKHYIGLFFMSRRNATFWSKVGKMGVGETGVGEQGISLPE